MMLLCGALALAAISDNSLQAKVPFHAARGCKRGLQTFGTPHSHTLCGQEGYTRVLSFRTVWIMGHTHVALRCKISTRNSKFSLKSSKVEPAVPPQMIILNRRVRLIIVTSGFGATFSGDEIASVGFRCASQPCSAAKSQQP